MEKDIDVLKDKLARACRLLEMTGLIDYSGHISARIPGSQVFLFTPTNFPVPKSPLATWLK